MKRANGEGSVVKLGGKRRKPFAVRVTVGWTNEGKQIVKYLGYYTKRTEAKEALRKYLVDPYDLTTKDMTLYEVYEKWLENPEISEKTLKDYTLTFKRLTALHKKPIRDIKLAQIEGCLGELVNQNRRLGKYVLIKVFEYAERHDLIDKNPMPLVKIQLEKGEERKALTQEEIKKVLNFKHPYSDVGKILLYSGMRIQELLILENANIDFEKRVMITGVKTAAGKNREIPIHDEILPTIKKWYDPNKKFLIRNTQGNEMAYNNLLKVYWKHVKVEVGSNITIHQLRHTFATCADKVGMNKVALKRIMGHSLKDITEHYTHKDLNELLNEINKIQY